MERIKKKKAYVVRIITNHGESDLVRQQGIEAIVNDNSEYQFLKKAYFNTIAQATAYQLGVNDVTSGLYSDIIIERVPVTYQLKGGIVVY